MQRILAALAMLVAGLILSHSAAAQQPATPSVAQQRYGGALGLPKDGAKLYLPDDAYPRWPLPPGEEKYGDVDGRKMKQVVDQITAFSRKSRDDGNQYWGRIPGTPYDRMTEDWVAQQFTRLGLQNVRRQELEMKPLWYPNSWKAEAMIGGGTVTLKTVFPLTETQGTPQGGILARAVWVGLGTAADFAGRDVKDKAVIVYSIPTPGGRNHSAEWNGAMRRASDAGAAFTLVVMGFPGDALNEPEGGTGTHVPTFTISVDEGTQLREAIEQGQPVSIRLQADIKEREGLKTGNVWGVLPGAGDETVLVMAHTDAFFEGALDNASGIAMMLEIARHQAALPQAQRRRTLMFLTTSDHHHGSIGVKWVHDHLDFSKVALIVNCEHPSQTLLYLLDAGIMTSNAVSARRWYVGGSAALKRLVTDSFRTFGVSVYTQPEARPGGELSQLFDRAPSFHIIDHVIYHTTLDTGAMVPAWGMEAATRAFLKVLDGVNGMSLQEIKS